MKRLLVGVMLLFFGRVATATQADDTVITISSKVPGATPFLSQVTLSVSDTSVLKSIQFTIVSKPGSDCRPLSGTYSRSYLAERGNIGNGLIFLPVYGLYANYTNTVTLTYTFNDGSEKEDTTTITTESFDDPCGYESPIVLQARIPGNSLSYDYILLKGACSNFSPAVMDTDGALRWVGTAGFNNFNVSFFQNSFFIGHGPEVYRNDLDGTVSFLGNYSGEGVVDFHHNVDPGKTGLLYEADTKDYLETIFMEIDIDGTLIKTWNPAEIVSAAMIAGGDDPAEFVATAPNDWFHNNSIAYNRADDSLIVSSRENFVIAFDYNTGAIKWILGDPTKAWYQLPSLKKYALTVGTDSLPPIGQHSVSLAYDQSLLLFDNGRNSFFEDPPGISRTYSSPRKYVLDLKKMTASEVWNYPMNESINSPFCSSIYEDLPLNYLVDYAYILGAPGQPLHARVIGLDATETRIFDYEYVTDGCKEIFNAIPLHLEKTAFPAIGPQSLNISTRGEVGGRDGASENALIGGFIITGSAAKTVVLRALGPSLFNQGVDSFLADPVITLYDAAAHSLGWNNDWRNGTSANQIIADGLAPSDEKESALRVTLNPGAYTAVITGYGLGVGAALVEVYDLSPSTGSKLANISTRGYTDSSSGSPLIGGFIIGANDSSTIVIRALGPSLSSSGVSDPLPDPSFGVYDQNGSLLSSNDNWPEDPNSFLLEQNQIAPTSDLEAATILHLPPGAYTAVVAGADGVPGIALVEIYNLE